MIQRYVGADNTELRKSPIRMMMMMMMMMIVHCSPVNRPKVLSAKRLAE